MLAKWDYRQRQLHDVMIHETFNRRAGMWSERNKVSRRRRVARARSRRVAFGPSAHVRAHAYQGCRAGKQTITAHIEIVAWFRRRSKNRRPNVAQRATSAAIRCRVVWRIAASINVMRRCASSWHQTVSCWLLDCLQSTDCEKIECRSMADNKGYDVISDTATAVAAAVIPKVGIGDVAVDDFGIGSDLWAFLCSPHRVDNFSSSHPVQTEHPSDDKLHSSDSFRFIVDVYVVGVICFIGFVGKLSFTKAQLMNFDI